QGSSEGMPQPSADQSERGQGQEDISPEMAEQLLKMLEKQAGERRQFLDQLPKELPGALKQLQQYEFLDPQAQQLYEELLNQLKQQVLDSMFQQMQQQLSSMSPEQLSQMRQMVQDLNQL